MVNMVLEDSLIRDLLEDAVDPTQHGGLAGSSARLQAATPVLSVVSCSTTLYMLQTKTLSVVQRYSSTTLPGNWHAAPRS